MKGRGGGVIREGIPMFDLWKGFFFFIDLAKIMYYCCRSVQNVPANIMHAIKMVAVYNKTVLGLFLLTADTVHS